MSKPTCFRGGIAKAILPYFWVSADSRAPPYLTTCPSCGWRRLPSGRSIRRRAVRRPARVPSLSCCSCPRPDRWIWGARRARQSPPHAPPEQPANHSKRRSPISRHSQQTSPTSAPISAPSLICVLSSRIEQKGVVPFFRTRSLHREAQAPPELKRAHPAERALYPLGVVVPGVGCLSWTRAPPG